MEIDAKAFRDKARAAVANPALRTAQARARAGFVAKRRAAAEALPEFDALRDEARRIKDHTLAHLDLYLEVFDAKVRESGGEVHYAENGAEARAIILALATRAGARTAAKGKTMVGEEIGLNPHLEAHGVVPVETDLGEYILQLRGEAPSHIIAPAVHLNREEIAADFRRAHTEFPPDRPLDSAAELMAEARKVLRDRFLAADVGITGANLLVAETGSAVIVTNEGNGDLAQTLPRVHIVLATIEKLVPTLNDAFQIVRVLARSGTGQDMSVYTTVATGPRRDADPDGPRQFHVVLLDDGRSALLGGEMEDMLRCIRCGACLNHCPVYQAVGGHAYGSTYAGPIGAVLTPALAGIEAAADLPAASTLCGRCEEVCPVRIPLPTILRLWRERSFAAGLERRPIRRGLAAWDWLASRPRLYRRLTRLATRVLKLMARRRGRLARLPLAGAWTRERDLPAPEGGTFQAQWRRRRP